MRMRLFWSLFCSGCLQSWWGRNFGCFLRFILQCYACWHWKIEYYEIMRVWDVIAARGCMFAVLVSALVAGVSSCATYYMLPVIVNTATRFLQISLSWQFISVLKASLQCNAIDIGSLFYVIYNPLHEVVRDTNGKSGNWEILPGSRV